MFEHEMEPPNRMQALAYLNVAADNTEIGMVDAARLARKVAGLEMNR